MPDNDLERTMTARIGPERCRSLLSGALDGHLALSRGALPIVVPVSCALDVGSLLVRAGQGLLGGVLSLPGIVAFHTTIVSLDESRRWEVLVRGRAKVVHDSAARELPPPLPLIDSNLTTVLRVGLELLTGWQYGPAYQSTRN